jgi:phage baseplate assembly protein W
MAREIGRVGVADLAENNYKILGLGINTSSNSNGIFSVNYTTLSQAKNNLINLILTKKGERVAQPEFGCDIWKVIFEPIIDDEISSFLENYINEAVSYWLPYIQIDDIFVETNDELKDLNTIRIEINFSLKSNPNLRESVKITIK